MSGSRIAWIDNAKIIAGILMILDHALLFFGHEGSWIRYTITRCAEPLYVFCFAYLVSVKGRGLSPKRWRQLAMAAVIETAIHSHREGILYLGILANLTCFGWLVGALRRMSALWLTALTGATSALAVISLNGPFHYIDYGPFLIASQFGLAVLAARKANSVAITLAASWLAALIASGVVLRIEWQPASSIWTILVGHLIAASILGCSSRMRIRWHLLRSTIVGNPLKFYLGHLLFLIVLTQWLKRFIPKLALAP